MSIEAKAKIVIQGGSEAVRTITGVDRSTQKAAATQKKAAAEQIKAQRELEKVAKRTAAEQAKAAQSAQRAQEKAAQATTKAAEKAAQAQVRAADKAAKETAAAADKAARDVERAAKKAADAEIREAKRAAKGAQRERTAAAGRVIRGGMRFMTAATAGVLAGGMSAMGTARGIAGQSDVGERIKRANSFQESLIITGSQAGVSREKRGEIQGKALDAAKMSATDPLDISDALSGAQKQFNAFEAFGDIIGEIAITAKANGANVGALTQATGYLKQAFILNKEETIEAMNLMVAGASAAAVELDDFATNFAPVAGIFAAKSGQTGLAGVRQFLGTSQAVGTGGFGSEQSATRVERFSADLRDKVVLKGLHGIGINPVGKDGKVDVGSVIEQLATNKKFANPTRRQDIFRDERSLQAVEAMLAARSRVQAGVADAVDYKTISSIDSRAGAKLTKDTFNELEGSGALALQREAIKMQNDTIEHLKAYNDQILAVVKVSNDLERSLGTLNVWASSIGTGAAATAGTSLLTSLGAAGGASTAAGAAGAGGVGALATGSIAGAAATVAGVLGAGAAGYFGAKALGADAAGEWIGNTLADFSHGSANDALKGRTDVVDFGKLDRTERSSSGSAASGSGKVDELLREQRTTNKLTRELIEATRHRGAPRIDNASRGPR